LDEVGATLTSAAFKSTLLLWPEKNIPKNMQARREKLLEIANAAMPAWKIAEGGLEIVEIIGSTGYSTPKEDLEPLIFKYIMPIRTSFKINLMLYYIYLKLPACCLRYLKAWPNTSR
jgi:hypothetical protein